MKEKNTLLFQEELYDYMDEFDRLPTEEEMEEMAKEQGSSLEFPLVLKIDKRNKKENKNEMEMV